jgi:LacI family transcriptional regulator
MKEGRFEPEGAAARRSRRPAPGRRPTMVDVANEARVSQTTVSLVLNHADGARLSAETRKRVLQAASRLGYQPVRRGIAPATAASALGFLCDELSTDPWTAIALDAVREKAWERGLTVLVMATRGDSDMEAAALAQFAQAPLAGLIYATINTRLVDPPAPLGAPTVLLNCHVANGSLPSVVPGEVAGGHAATDHLIAAGHRRIGYVNGEPSMEAARHRLRGYKQALATADLPVDPALVRDGNWQPLSGYEATRELMRLPSPPTAIFCANDLMAMGCYEALRELGLRIPADVAVMGYDDREIARALHPPLSTMLLPHYEMAAIAAEWLFDLADGAELRPRQIKVECPLIKRGST